MAMILRTDLTILLLRKESGSTVEFVRAVKKNLQSDIAQSFSMAVNKKPIQLLKDTQTEIHTNLFTDQGSKESQLVADGVRSAITGKHFKRIYTDDIIPSRIESQTLSESRRITSTKSFRTSVTKGGVILNTGTPWHKQGHLQTHAKPEIHSIYDTGLLTRKAYSRRSRA